MFGFQFEAHTLRCCLRHGLSDVRKLSHLYINVHSFTVPVKGGFDFVFVPATLDEVTREISRGNIIIVVFTHPLP